MTMAATPAGALGHIRVLDLSRVLAGPWASQTLGDLGADVVKVERAGTGDDTRAWGPPFVTNAAGQPTGESAYYQCANRNKRSVAIDITQPAGQALVRELAQRSDVLIENFKTGGLAAYGLDADSLLAINPRLVYCSITGFGHTGPYAHRAGYDFLIQGMGRLMSVTGQPDDAPGGGPAMTMPHPQAGPVPMVASPIRLSDTPVSYRAAPPQLGQHPREVLTDDLGLPAEAIQQLFDQGVLA